MPTTVVLGAGIIGLSTAHALARLAPPDHRIHIVEPAPKLFSSASGKAAGFLAKDWFAPATASLGVLSFEMHRALAEAHNGRARWGYSESISYSLDHAYQSDSDTSPVQDPAPKEVAPGTTDRTAASSQSEPDVLSVRTGSTASDSTAAKPAASNYIDESHEETSGGSGSGLHGQTQGQAQSEQNTGLDWLLNGTSRATVVDAESIERVQMESVSGDTPRDMPSWLVARPEALEVISDKSSTAQMIPRRLCEFLLEQCLAAGVTLHHPARATKLMRNDKDPEGVTRIRVEYTAQQQQSESPDRARVVDIPCENIVIAAGCWTPQVYATLFPNASRMPRITHLAGYSVTLKSKHWPPVAVPADPNAIRLPYNADALSDSDTSSIPAFLSSSPCHAVFTDTAGFAPEIFSRATGDVWLGGLNPTTTPLPALPTEAEIDPAEIDRLLTVARALCGNDVEVRKQALCFRPVSATGRPILARMHEADLGDGLKPGAGGGVYVATGHGPWGISLSLGTGQVMAEMVLGRETSANVEALSRW